MAFTWEKNVDEALRASAQSGKLAMLDFSAAPA